MLRKCLALSVFLGGCTGQIAEQTGMGDPATPGVGGAGPASSTSDAASSTGSNGTTTGGSATQTTGSGGVAGNPATGAPAAMAAPRVARLTHFQWANSVQDLLRLENPPTQVADFTPDAIIGFDTNRSQLRMSGTLREDYERAAEALATQVVNDPAALARIMPADAPTEPDARARAFIESFGLRAYRRPLTEAEVDQHLSLFEQAPELAPDLEPFSAGVMLSIRLFLQSPYFLYRTELSQGDVNGRIPLSGYEVASKLALSLTGSIPDDELLQAAATGSLDPGNNPATVDAEAQRLLATPRAKAMALHLHTQALALSRYSLIQKNSEKYPEFTATTPTSIRSAADLFLGALYDSGQGLRALLTSTEAFVDANLAPIYGLSGDFGAELQRVDLAGLPRSGILTQPGFLALFAGENEPDPIHRGVFINQQLLCFDIPPPGVEIPPLPEPLPNQTNRQRIDAITGPGTCGQGCHATYINPLGYAFENYDPIGRYRTTDNGIAIDASGTYELDGAEVAFANAQELAELLANSEAAHRCYASHWLSYLDGRLTDAGDDAILDEVSSVSKNENLSFQDVIRRLVQSEAFLTRPVVEQL